ncbi:hypothetical protein ACH5RR_017189 [Cinchona calisaya]|uniref:Pentatricopeptide repeat-containing protein n=1 Tax=Cinchona calisaya TaxID=153742 RepID=A0ABD3A1E6_9GENT
MKSSDMKPDYYTFLCALKACSASNDLRFGPQIHTQVPKMALDANLYVGNGLIAMYRKCEMRESMTLDPIAFVPILSASSHAGLVDEGLVGRVCEAYDFIKQMPIEPNETVWGSFLSACRFHNDMDIALEAEDHLF